MQIISEYKQLRSQIAEYRKQGKKIAFVPTMGFLHEGHLSLVDQARQHGQIVVVSIFVNPLQFNNPDDFAKYPINLEKDFSLLRERQVDITYTPSVDQIYPKGTSITVMPGTLADGLEGEFRPGHFMGVATVVSILFNQVQPDYAVFGEKDFQQLRIIESLVHDLSFPVLIVRGKLIRELNGLAMSSRNSRLSPEGIQQALALITLIKESKKIVAQGETDVSQIISGTTQTVLKNFPGFSLEYFYIIDEKTLLPIDTLKAKVAPRVVLAGYVEGVRLIDTDAL